MDKWSFRKLLLFQFQLLLHADDLVGATSATSSTSPFSHAVSSIAANGQNKTFLFIILIEFNCFLGLFPYII